MLSAAWVTFKQHRFEVIAATLAALAVGVWQLITVYRLAGVNVPSECHAIWRAVGPEGAGDCLGPMRTWAEILYSAEAALNGPGSMMGILPFALGLLGGVPIVARELEAGTAQTAWSLNGSRLRWLARQVIPIAILLGAAVTFAALAADALQTERALDGYPAFLDLGLHGPLVVIRAFAAFGLGLLVGSMLGRTLPAFVFGIGLTLAVVFAVGQARETWLGSLPAAVIERPSANPLEWEVIPGSVATSWGWYTPAGDLISKEEARALATAAGVPPPEPSDVQDTPAAVWLDEHGYRGVSLGVTEEMALGWAPYDGITFGLVGLTGIGSAIVLVNRRRPM